MNDPLTNMRIDVQTYPRRYRYLWLRTAGISSNSQTVLRNSFYLRSGMTLSTKSLGEPYAPGSRK